MQSVRLRAVRSVFSCHHASSAPCIKMRTILCFKGKNLACFRALGSLAFPTRACAQVKLLHSISSC